jgi:hypothetical protein
MILPTAPMLVVDLKDSVLFLGMYNLSGLCRSVLLTYRADGTLPLDWAHLITLS